MVIELKTKMVALDQNHQCVVVLMNDDETMILPIWIGLLEAQAITLTLAGEVPLRPLTHDLMTTLLEETETKVDKVVLTGVTAEGTYLAEIHLNYHGQEKVIDSRPSDAIALALRNNAKIFMTDALLDCTQSPEDFIPEEEAEPPEGAPLH